MAIISQLIIRTKSFPRNPLQLIQIRKPLVPQAPTMKMKPSKLHAMPMPAMPASPTPINKHPFMDSHQPSKPIPIQRTRTQAWDESVDSNDAAHYDWATWRMYARITNARRLRKYCSPNTSFVNDSNSTTQEEFAMVNKQPRQATNDPAMSHDSRDRRMSMEEPPYDGVFILDPM